MDDRGRIDMNGAPEAAAAALPPMTEDAINTVARILAAIQARRGQAALDGSVGSRRAA